MITDLEKRAVALSRELEMAKSHLKIDELIAELKELRQKSEEPGFWSDKETAQQIMQRIAVLQERVDPWQKLELQLKDILELIRLGDESLSEDLTKQLDEHEKSLASLKKQLKFTGPYDDHSAIVSIYAGAGGTDAQDWAQMLMRMYMRWADGQGFKTQMIDESPGEEAGLKSATLEINGDLVYGRLKGEHGVHRLVRLSPFNADHLRQTSFARVDILPKITQTGEIKLDEKDLRIDVFRSSGKGGQSVNTTDSAVRVTHLPTGISVTIQNERSQLQNKETALTILRSKLAQLQLEQHKEKLSEIKGQSEQATWGNQIRNYVLHPYKQVKDIRTGYESKDPDKVLDGELNGFIDAYLEQSLQA